MLERTVVTAAKTGEGVVQSIPMAISAVSSAELGRLGLTTVQAAALAPSVTFTQNSNLGQLSIRGIGINAVYAGADHFNANPAAADTVIDFGSTSLLAR